MGVILAQEAQKAIQNSSALVGKQQCQRNEE